MLSTPGVLALVGGSILLCVFMTVVLVAGFRVVFGWDPGDGGEKQLRRERQVLLVESTLGVFLWLELSSLFLFVSVVDRIHPMLTGAMCAAGTLNANSFGYPSLWAKTATFGLCGLWLILNRASGLSTTVGLLRCKQALLLLIWGSLVLESALQVRFFSALNPDVLTSCCATVFDDGGAGLGSNIATVPVSASMAAFSLLVSATFVIGLLVRRHRAPAVLFAIVSGLAGVVCALAVVTWVAPAYYQLPTHHCPFCLLAPGVGWVGYPLLGSLGIAVVTGIGVGLVRGARFFDPSNSIKSSEELRLCSISMTAFAVFSAVAVWPLIGSGFRLGVMR